MKVKVLIGMFFIAILLFGTGITYSIFTSDGELKITDQKIAKFVFDAKPSDYIELPLTDLYPGIIEEYAFQVSNNASSVVSNVTLEYQIMIKTYHFMPLEIQLYKIENDTEQLVMTCDESYTRNTENELICNSSTQQMKYDQEILDNYKIKVTFPTIYNTEEYTNLVDYIDVEINSWQKLEK